MADKTLDDVYDDPDNILVDTDDDVNGAVELSNDEKADISQSIYNPMKNTTDLDDRGPIDELELSDGGETDDRVVNETIDPALLDESRGKERHSDGDSFHPGDVNPSDENDNTEN